MKKILKKGEIEMKLTKRQQELDVIKWNKSQELGYDACGSFDYCVKCNKNLENPCDKAFQKFNKKPTAKKVCKTTAKKEVATTKAKKSK
jgi:hypothetical protein